MNKKERRSQGWFGKTGKDGLIYRSWFKKQGIPTHELGGKPIIGICNTWSELTPCNSHFRELAEFVKKGILEAGGYPVEFPVMSLGETVMKPTAMLYRNLASMDTEESIRANPLDGVVLLCGCDKTTPSLVMGAASVNLPTIVVSGGPMLTGRYRGKEISTSDIWRFSESARSGEINQAELYIAESGLCRSDGHCGVMGTASTMACMVESLGLSLPGNAAIPAPDTGRKVMAHMSGMEIVKMVENDLKMSDILTREAFENAIMVNAAIGGSTNFVIHLLAIAGRMGINLDLEDFDKYSTDIPLLANLQPSGKYFMEDFYYAGGLPPVIRQLKDRLHNEAMTVTGQGIGKNNEKFENYNKEVIAAIDEPFNPLSGIVVLKGNLCETGSIIKPSAASPELMKHTGKAVVFEDIDDYKNKIDDPDLDIDENSIMVLKNVGPKGYPGMPEVGNMGLPPKVLAKGIKDMVRISDGRMSGTGFGTVILHATPEAAEGGNFAVVQTGDEIELDVEARKLNLLVSDEELAKRKTAWKKPVSPTERGYVSLYVKTVEQANLGADLDFLKGNSGSEVTKDSH
ncbi:MAG: dihydroxy-acid dehydratase [Cytophagales bacterium]|uniref:IlvD/Edd family dehydratase n=1 Tax=Cyclobacterium marinum TaxID=104 RepID=UPI0030DB5C13|nr:dihydroxy-acid dehydratase [Cytophagales bacterium]|tara:strand:+ start:15454 stop:17169 length:1716 start_codon:yes stop_codon:yes gene_type:complete